jgi:IS605 OrfB family transposase
VRIQPRDSYQRETLSKIASGEWRHGNVLIERDKRERWFFRIAYTRIAPPTTHGSVAAINRGIRVFLACVTDADERWLYDGNDIVAYLKQMQARRREYQYDSKASGRSGHGRRRILRPVDHLSDKGGRWRATKCQTIARRLVDWLVARSIKTLLVEDFSGIRNTDLGNDHIVQLIQEWPYYQLEQRIRSCCAEVGIEVVTLAPHYISQQCPKCGFTDEGNRDMSRWKLKCGQCGYSEHLDAAAAKNLLGRDRSGDAPPPKGKTRKKSGVKNGPGGTARKPLPKGAKTKRSPGTGRKGPKKR